MLFSEIEDNLKSDMIRLEQEDLETDFMATIREHDSIERTLIQTESQLFGINQ